LLPQITGIAFKAAPSDIGYATVWLNSAERIEPAHMTFGQEIQLLRNSARRLHEMATAHQTTLSDQLLVMAVELLAPVGELERQQDNPGSG
jgi:hypothetical protein